MNKKLFSLLKKTSRIGFYLCLFAALLQLIFVMSLYYSEHPECVGVSNFFNQDCLKEEYMYSSYGLMPAGLKYKIALHEEAITYVRAAILFFIVFEIFHYLELPSEHWITPIFNKLKKANIKLEED